jgi:hypothetical protein
VGAEVINGGILLAMEPVGAIVTPPRLISDDEAVYALKSSKGVMEDRAHDFDGASKRVRNMTE